MKLSLRIFVKSQNFESISFNVVPRNFNRAAQLFTWLRFLCFFGLVVSSQPFPFCNLLLVYVLVYGFSFIYLNHPA